MARVNMSRKVLVFQYKGHCFYSDTLDPDAYLVHIDPRGKEIDSRCYDEDEAFAYVENKDPQRNKGYEE